MLVVAHQPHHFFAEDVIHVLQEQIWADPLQIGPVCVLDGQHRPCNFHPLNDFTQLLWTFRHLIFLFLPRAGRFREPGCRVPFEELLRLVLDFSRRYLL